MQPVVAAIDPVLATLILSVLVLLAGVYLSVKAMDKTAETQKSVFAIVGVLFGLLAAGGLGSLFASKVAESSAEDAAQQSATEAASQVQSGVADEVDRAIEEAQNTDQSNP